MGEWGENGEIYGVGMGEGNRDKLGRKEGYERMGERDMGKNGREKWGGMNGKK